MRTILPQSTLKVALLGFFICLIYTQASFAQAPKNSEPAKQLQDSVVKQTAFYFEKNQGWWMNNYDQTEIFWLVDFVKRNSNAKIKIYGWADASGDVAFNENISGNRALTAQRYLVNEQINPSRITYEGKGVDTSVDSLKARRADIIAYIEVLKAVEKPIEPKPLERTKPAPAPERKPEPKPQEQPKPKPEQKPEPQVQTEPQTPVAVQQEYVDHKFSLRTNLLYWLVGSINLGAEWNPANTSLGVLLNAGYSPFGGANWEHNLSSWFVSPELRYYLGESKGWFVGAQFLAGGYNFKLGETGYQGTVMAGGVTGGYKMWLSNTFDMDFSVGAGYGTLSYDSYYHENGYNVYKERDVKKSQFMPIQAGVSLIWKIK